jgi:hypothetical protein
MKFGVPVLTTSTPVRLNATAMLNLDAMTALTPNISGWNPLKGTSPPGGRNPGAATKQPKRAGGAGCFFPHRVKMIAFGAPFGT